MKKAIRIALVLILPGVVMLALGSCELWISIFGPDPNNITQWVPRGIESDTVEKFTVSGELTGSITFTFASITEGSSKTSVKFSSDVGFLWPSGTNYWHFSSDDDAVYWGAASSVQSTDTIMLQTPVEEGTSWTTPILDLGNWDFEIKSVKQSASVEAETYNDVVVVEATSTYYIDTFTFYWSVEQGLIKVEDSWTSSGTSYVITIELSEIS